MNQNTELINQSDTSLHSLYAGSSIPKITHNNNVDNKMITTNNMTITSPITSPISTIDTPITTQSDLVVNENAFTSELDIDYDLGSPFNINSIATEDIDYDLDDDVPLTALLTTITSTSEDIIFAQNGYKKVDIISDTLQGQLFKAQRLNNNIAIEQKSPTPSSQPEYVAIKRTDKSLFDKNIAIQDEINFVVSENIIKESMILKYLTMDNKCIGDYIIKYIDFFESESDYYLVMEFVQSQMNLKQFINICFKYIHKNKLQLKEYQKVIKYLYWQLIVTIRWLHDDMNC